MDYKSKYKTALKRNIDQVLQELETEEMVLKISNWADKYGFSFNTIKNKIKTDEIFRCIFAKDPSKQNLYQNLAAAYIASLKIVKNFRVLPSSGKQALYLSKGKLFDGEQLDKRSKETKSIDFAWNVNKFTFYASHKYTEMTGGAQDNQ